MKHVMEQYQLLVNMHDDVPRNNTTNENLNLIYNLELILGLHVVLPFLDYVHILIKFAQFRNMFVCDFINAMKICHLKFYLFYNDPYIKFDDPSFNELNVLETFTNDNLSMS